MPINVQNQVKIDAERETHRPEEVDPDVAVTSSSARASGRP